MTIEEFCLSNGIYNYNIDDSGKINTEYSVGLSYKNLKKLPFKFGIVGGDFNVSNNLLTDLEGCPDLVNGVFSASHNKLTSLKGCPSEVNGDLFLQENNLTDLEYFPKKVNGSVYLRNNKLTSLKGCARKINGDFSIYDNLNLENLKYGPQIVNGEYNAIGCNIKTLEYLPNKLDSIWLSIHKNPVHSIVDSTKYDDLLVFKECKVVKGNKVNLKRLKLYLNIVDRLYNYEYIIKNIEKYYELI